MRTEQVMHLLNIAYSADQDNYQDALTNLRLLEDMEHPTSSKKLFSTEDHQQTSMWQTL
jgi:hypothetical protein